ncbi:MAG TPA: CHAT domain-containing tetratricopeptide repeat protein [Planktothrix sp.]|jgi:CHAT domain-containing protein/tetratricopeptide (TPR) repeat protein
MESERLSLNEKRTLMERHGQDAWAALEAANFDKAEQEYQKAIELARHVSERGAEAVFLSFMAVAQQELGKHDVAKTNLENAVAIAREFGLTKVEAHGCRLLAEQEREAGHSDQAIQLFLRALEASYNSSDPLGMEISFGSLGQLYLERGWAEQAAEWFEHALGTRDETQFRAQWLGSLGQAMAELAQYDSAIGYYRRAFDEASKKPDSRTQAVCLGSEGNAHFELGDMDGAIKCYERALKLSEESEDNRRCASWLGNIGNTWLKLGNVAKAVDYCGRAVETAKSSGDAQAQASHLDSLGDCQMAQGELNLAMDKYNEALALSNTINDRLGQRIYLSNLGRLYQQMGQLQPAFELLDQAIDLFDEQRSAIKADDLKTSFANRGQELYRDMVKICLSMGKRVEALEFVGRAKSRALLDLLSNSPIDISQLEQTSDESLKKLIAKEGDLRNQIAQFERLFWQGPPASETGHRGSTVAPEDSQKIYSEWREAINQLRRRHPNYASLVSAGTLNFSEIESLWNKEKSGGGHLLDRQTAIVEFYWTDQYIMAASVHFAGGEPVVHSIFDDETREALEVDLYSFLEMSATEGWEVPLSLCKRLYKALMQPVVSGLPDSIKRLLVVPHGSLHHLPFAALHDETGFLCEKYSISYLPTTSLIPVLAKPDQEADETMAPGYLVSAISDYSATRKEGMVFSSRLRSAAGLEDLSYTMEEAANIYDLSAQKSSTAKLLTNEEVKHELPELFSKYSIVHFAGHAVFNQEEPLASGLVLSDGSILSAASILQGNVLRTNCGKLLVLSACQTGVSMVTKGGEILGLARALMYAGMPNLVLSLWEVADRSTADLMQEFHKELIGMSGSALRISDALRAAQAKAARSGQPVHAWAPFIHLGIE